MNYEAPKVETKVNVAAEFGAFFGQNRGQSKSFRINGS